MAFRTVGFTDIFSTKSEKTLQERMTAVWTYPNRLYDPNNYSLELIIGEYLIDFFDHENGGDMISKIRILREQLKNEIGFDLPQIHFVGNSSLDYNSYKFFSFRNLLREGKVYPYKFDADPTSVRTIENDSEKFTAFSKAKDELIAQLRETILANITLIEESKGVKDMIQPL